MKEYVAGFLFDDSSAYVALVKKIKGPSAVVGKWNAIGGKVEPGEDPADAMNREFIEEANANGNGQWQRFLILNGQNNHEPWRVHFYVLFDTHALHNVKQMEEEEIVIFFRQHPPEMVDNLSWILPMALDFRKSRTAHSMYEDEDENYPTA